VGLVKKEKYLQEAGSTFSVEKVYTQEAGSTFSVEEVYT
jgi:hypothetical protein